MITYLLPGERGKFELSGKLALGICRLRDSPKFSEQSIGYRAHRAVTFAIAWLYCSASSGAAMYGVFVYYSPLLTFNNVMLISCFLSIHFSVGVDLHVQTGQQSGLIFCICGQHTVCESLRLSRVSNACVCLHNAVASSVPFF